MRNVILIQVAMEVECQEILKKINNLKEKNISGYKFYEGDILDYKVVVSLLKVGLIEASSSLTVALCNYKIKAIINAGISGATDVNLHIKDIVIATSCININSYRTPYKSKNEGTNPNEWELITFLSGEEDRLIEQKASSYLIDLTKNVNTKYNVYYGIIGSGDVWNNEIDRILYLSEQYNILTEDMEAIATYTIANKWNIPVISIKMISDNSLIKEEYNRSVGIDLQEYVLLYIEEVIKNM